VLGVLIEKRGTLVSKDEIMRAVWQGTAVEEHNLTVQIAALRRLLDEDYPSESCIQTVTGRGYRFRPTTALQVDGDRVLRSSIHSPEYAPNSRSRLSLVVLPFKSLSDDSEKDYLAEIITDALSTDLSSWWFTFVISSRSAGIPETTPIDFRQLGVKLGVNYVIHGSVRGSADRRRIFYSAPPTPPGVFDGV
jgi:DNA-binding winged helix-turn-helix (wHTH) protein